MKIPPFRQKGRPHKQQVAHTPNTTLDTWDLQRKSKAKGNKHEECEPQDGPLVHDGRGDCLCHGKLRIQPQGEDHAEEEERPERRDGKVGEGCRIGYEC